MSELTTNQRDILSKLAVGWYLDRAGKDGLGGHLWIDGKKGRHVSVADMTKLFDYCISWDSRIDTFVITDAGRAALST